MAPFLLVTKSSPPSGGSEKITLTAEHLSYYGDRGSKTVKAYYHRVLYRAWGSPPIVDGHALCSIAGALYKPRTPHGTEANTPVLAATTTKRPLTKVL